MAERQEAIGVVGLGTMGLPIATRLVERGYAVYGYDLKEDRRIALGNKGGSPVGKLDEFPAECRIFLLVLPERKSTENAIRGEHGLSGALKSDDILINLGTIGPSAVLELERALRLQRARLLDAPMGKSSKEALEGTLSLMVSGDEAVFNEVRSILQAIATTIVFCGEVGVASTIKIINNLVSASILAVVVEGLTLGVRAGAPSALMAEVLSQTGADSWHLRNTVAQRVFNRNFQPGFSIDLAAKDLKIGVDLAAELQMPLPLISQVYQRFVEAQSLALGTEDWGALAKLNERAISLERPQRTG